MSIHPKGMQGTYDLGLSGLFSATLLPGVRLAGRVCDAERERDLGVRGHGGHGRGGIEMGKGGGGISIRPSTESILIGSNAHADCKIRQTTPLRGCSESTRIHLNPTLHRILPNPETPSQSTTTLSHGVGRPRGGGEGGWLAGHSDPPWRDRPAVPVR